MLGLLLDGGVQAVITPARPVVEKGENAAAEILQYVLKDLRIEVHEIGSVGLFDTGV